MVKIFLAALLITGFMVTTVSAQANPPSLIVDSNPPGAQVDVIGPLSVSSLTPATFIQPMVGEYDIEVHKDGYETHKSSVLLEPGKTASLSVNLKEKTRYKSALRSLLIPGWGQLYSDQKGKGIFFLSLVAATGVGALVVHGEFKDREDEYDAKLLEYNTASSFEDRERLYPELQAAKKDVYDAETARMIAIYAVAGAWGLNLIDALFFFPDRSGHIVDHLSVRPNENLDGAQVNLTVTF